MPPFADASTIEPLGMLPIVVAVLLLSVGGRMLADPHRQQIADSGWFWAFIFSTVGLLGVWAISKKYDDREKRLEARYVARQRIAQERARQNSPGADGRSGDDQATATEPDDGQMEAGYQSQRQVPLRFLAGGLLAVSVGSAIMLWRAAASARPTERR